MASKLPAHTHPQKAHAHPQKAHTHPQNPVYESKLLRQGPFDAQEELESSLHEAYTNLQSQLTSYTQPSSRSDADLVQLNRAFIYGFLTQPQAQQSLIIHLAAVTRDGYACFVSILLRLVNELYPKLLDQPRRHLLWLARQLINFSASEVDTLCLSLLRHIVGGDIGQWNVWLAGQMLDILRSNWSWFVGHPGLLTNALFTFLRLLPDHFMAKNPVLNELKQDEVAFCVKILRDCFQDCLAIGRDLVRLLQDVACIPEFEPVWKDLLSNPSAFNSVEFADIAQLYVVRTPSRYLASRLTPEMEAQIRFMLTYVRMGSQQRYQAWFVKRFLTAPGSETLVCDLIRFICCVHHPTNQTLQSDIVPRWAVLGWLLKCCKSPHVEANAKLALFYDWLFFMNKTDNIMNVEPALLLMVYSIPKYVDMTRSLLEFLFLCIEHYDPQRKDLVLCGVTAAVDILVEKGVVQSLKPLSSSPHVVPWLQKKLVEYFPTYCQVDAEVHMEGKQEVRKQGISSIRPVPVRAAQASVSKKIEAPPNADVWSHAGEGFAGGYEKAAVVPGQASREPSNDLLGSISHKKIIDVEGEGFARDHDKVAMKESLCQAIRESSDDDLLGRVSHKKGRVDEGTLSRFSEVLKRPHDEEAVDVFEKLLLSYLSEFDKTTEERREDQINVEGNNAKEMAENGAESVEILAKKVSGVLKRSAYVFFAPLRAYSPDCLESDEMMSVTSAVFRMYTHSFHPQLLQILLSWQTEGFAVGARFLCYACRLAEDSSPPYTSLDVDPVVIQTTVKHERVMDAPTCNRRKDSKLSALSWHQRTHAIGNWKVGAEPAAVAESFKAYQAFLKGLKEKVGHFLGASPTDQAKSVNGTRERILMKEHDLDSMFLEDLEKCLTWSTCRLLSIFSFVFSYLPDLSRGKENVIKLLVSTVDPVELVKLELKLSLKELSVFGRQSMCIINVVKSSLLWDCFEQQYLWRLLIAELQNPTPLFVSDFVKACVIFLEPAQHCEAVSGLLALLRMQCCTSHLMFTMLLLPQDYGKLVAAVLAAWVSLDASRFLQCVTALAQERSLPREEPSKNREQHLPSMASYVGSALWTFSTFLDNFLRVSDEVDENKKLEIVQIKQIVLELAERWGLKTVTDAWVNSAKT